MNFMQAKQRKERGASVSDLAEELYNDKEKYSDVVIVALTHDKEIEISYSSDEATRVIGMLEVAKDVVVDEIRGE